MFFLNNKINFETYLYVSSSLKLMMNCSLKIEISFLVAEEVTHCIFARNATGSWTSCGSTIAFWRKLSTTWKWSTLCLLRTGSWFDDRSSRAEAEEEVAEGGPIWALTDIETLRGILELRCGTKGRAELWKKPIWPCLIFFCKVFDQPATIIIRPNHIISFCT